MDELFINYSKLLNIRPGSIIIEKFIPGKIYRRAIEIENISQIPVIINLKASDRNKLLLNKSLLRLDVKEKQIIELIIQDTINYQKAKYPIDPKIISINITGELIETKFMITLKYIPNKNKYKESSNLFENQYERQIPNVFIERNLKPLYNKNFIRSRKLLVDNVCNIFIQRNENNRIISLKKVINNLKKENYLLKQKNQNLDLNKPKNFKIKNKSLFILGNKLNDPEHKFKIDNEIELKALRNKNIALQVENSILVEKIKNLENLISINNFEEQKYNYLKDNENESVEDNRESDIHENDMNDELEEQEEKEMEIQKENDENYLTHNNLKNNISYYDEFLFN